MTAAKQSELPRCSMCGREFAEGESGWVEDWTVIGDDHRSARRETRYTCDDCEATR